MSTPTHKALPFIAGLFTASLLISNTISSKVFELGPITLTAGIILIPISYVFGDLLTEVYGYSASRKVIWSGIAGQALMTAAYLAADALPPAPFWPHQEAFHEVLTPVPRIAVASVAALFAGEFVNSYVIAKMKVWTNGRLLGVRYICSTVVGQGLDTVVFSLVAFLGVFTPSEIVRLGLSAWGLKIVWECLALPLSVPLTAWLKRHEGGEVFDRGTNFSPFVLAR